MKIDLDQSIRLYQGADFDPDPEVRYPGLIVLACCIAAGALTIGVGYALYQAFEAIAS